MTYIPQIPKKADDPNFARMVSKEMERIFRYVYELGDQVKGMKEHVGIEPSASTPVEVVKVIEREVLPAPFNVQSTLGQTAQVQLPGLSKYETLPATTLIGNDPKLQDTAMLRVGDQLYVVDEMNRLLIPLTGGARQVDITPVSVNANVTTEQNLMDLVIPAGHLNSLNKVCHLYAWGTLDELSGPTIVFRLYIGSTVIIQWTPNTPGATRTGLGWSMRAMLVTAATGASGNFEAHGQVGVDSNTTGSTGADQHDGNVAVTSNFDLTGSLTLKLTIAFSAGSTSNVGRQRVFVAEY